jgi:hypothetical protein
MQDYLKGHVLRAGVLAGVIGAIVLLASLIPFIGFCFALLTWIVYVGAGVLAVMWSKGTAATVQQLGIDGALAGGIAGLIAGLVKWVADVFMAVVFGAVFSSGVRSTAVDIVSTIIFGLFGVIVGIIVAAVLGAIGALVYNAIQQQQSKPGTNPNP